MDTKGNGGTDKKLSLPRGITIVGGKKERLRLFFMYRGVQCREMLAISPTPGNIKYAERLLGEIKNEIERSTFNYAKHFPNSKKLKLFGYAVKDKKKVEQLLREYLAIKKNSVAKSTYRPYEGACKYHLIPQFGDCYIDEIKFTDIRNWIAGLKLTKKTVRNILTPLWAIFNDALADEVIVRNPLQALDLSQIMNRETSSSNFEVDPFTSKEIDAIYKTAKGQFRNMLMFAFFTGLRISELFALRWGDIDWVEGLIHVTRASVDGEDKCTKTEAGKRDVMLLPPALEALIDQKSYTYMERDHVFRRPFDNKPWMSDNNYRHGYWEPTLLRAGVRYRNPYQTRHTYACMMLSRGENMLWLAGQMGHADTTMIIKTYGKKYVPQVGSHTKYNSIYDWSKEVRGLIKSEFDPRHKNSEE